MKTWKISLWSILMILSAFSFSACSDSNDEKEITKKTFVLSSEGIDLTLNNVTTYTPDSGKDYEIIVTTQDDVAWHTELKTGDDFASIEPEGDKTGSGSVKIKIPANQSFEERKAIVVISSSIGNTKKEITFIQEAKVDKTFHFAVMGDLHYGLTSKGGSVDDRVPPAMQYITQNHPDIKAFFLVGDVTDNGTEAEFTGIKKMVEDNLPTGANAYFMMGNHDLYKGKDIYSRIIGQPLNQYIERNGYPFITLSLDKTSNPYYEETSFNFLKEHLKTAAETYPGKPIFVFGHVPPKHTTWGDTWECTNNEDLHEELSKYPQVIFFTGHTHFTIEDERSITQNKYTWINAGPSHYGVISLAITPDISAYRSSGHWINEALVVEVDEESNVTVTRLNTRERKTIDKKWVIKSPHDGSQFRYTYPVKDRTDKDDRPTMSGTLTVSDVSETSCKITFPQGSDDIFVYHYKVDVTATATNEVVSSKYVFSEFYWKNNNEPRTLNCDIVNLSPNTAYKVAVKAVDSFESESEAIEAVFTTKAMPDIDPSVKAPVADLVDVAFTNDGARNLAESSGLTVTRQGNGTPNIYNSALRMYVTQPATTGSTANYYMVNFKNNAQYVNGVKDGFTWEVYCKTSDIKTMQYPMSNLQSAGMGFTFNETYNEPKGETFFAMMRGDGKYHKVAFMKTNEIKTGTYYHLLFTWDGERISLYKDGEYVASEPCKKLTMTSGDAQYICIGADSNSSPSAQAQNGFKGEVAVARVYSKPVNASEAASLYRQLSTRAGIIEFDELNRLLTAGTLNPDLTAEGWELMNNLATTQSQVQAFITKAQQR